jgi:alpha-galactosidase
MQPYKIPFLGVQMKQNFGVVKLHGGMVPSTFVIATLIVLMPSACSRKGTPTKGDPVRERSAVDVQAGKGAVRVETTAAQFVLLPTGYLQAALGGASGSRTLDDPSEQRDPQVIVGNKEVGDFVLDLAGAKVSEAAGKLGRLGKRIEIRGTSQGTGLTETIAIEVYDEFQSVALVSAAYQNTGNRDVRLDSVSIVSRKLNASLADSKLPPYDMWSFHGASIRWGKDDVLRISKKFSQENPFGTAVETEGDLGRVGGGIPVVAFWTRNVGVAIGHVETLPMSLSIPVKTQTDGKIHAAVQLSLNTTLKPGDVYSTPRAFVAVYAGDFYEPLSLWSKMVDREGLSRPTNNDENYAISWCGWGYEANVTPKQMIDTIPKLKELGIHWATLDDRWFNNYGDWQPRSDDFPGDAIEKMVKTFHEQGIKVQIWWLPLAAEDGNGRYSEHKYVLSDVVKQHPDWLILDKSGKHAMMARNLPTLCPALPEVQAYYKQLTERFIKDWDFDGHKLDNIYSTPLCYNPKHHHKSPMDSVYAMGDVYRIIFETTRRLKPESVTQSCPCGTPPSLAWFRYMDQAVTADPVGSVQVRRRIKMYKALLGPNAAVYGDHVELTRIRSVGANEQDLGRDFASTLGSGGVLGTKFTWPDYGPRFKNVMLTPDKEEHWKKWISLYNQKMLSKGNFRDLYVIGYDNPEGYAIEKDGKMYYAFFASSPEGMPESWRGDLELRGLNAGQYHVTDYVNGKDYGNLIGPTGKLKVDFNEDLLLEAEPLPAH